MSFSRSSAFLAAVAFAAPALAADMTPVGTWTQIDDTTHKPKSIIVISETSGKLEGKVVEVLQSDQGPHPVCKECAGERKDKPIEGMTILWGVQKDGDVWDGGQILDPKSGKIYKVKMSVADNGEKLEVRGYVGFSLLGRSQVWERKAP